MTTLRQAAEQALEAIDDLAGYRADIDNAITALRQALEAEQQDEPVAEVLNSAGEVDYFSYVPEPGTQLYTHPHPAQQPLTREQVKEILTQAGYDSANVQARADFINGIRHGERAHHIGGEA